MCVCVVVGGGACVGIFEKDEHNVPLLNYQMFGYNFISQFLDT